MRLASDRYRAAENSLLTKHVVAAGLFARDAGSTPAASTILRSEPWQVPRLRMAGHLRPFRAISLSRTISGFAIFLLFVFAGTIKRRCSTSTFFKARLLLRSSIEGTLATESRD